VTINVLEDGTLLLSGRHTPATELKQRLSDRLREAGPSLQVRIRGDRYVPYRFVEPILLACAQAGIWDVSFSVFRPEDVR
jgi:biopolymer transport protein ExbD